MRRSICRRVLLWAVCILACTTAWGQQAQKTHTSTRVSADLAITYAPERAQFVPGQCCFWMQGGGADAALTFWKGIGIAASLAGGHASNYSHGMDVNKIAFLVGPRYTYTAWANQTSAAETPRFQVFAEGLIGGVHGFNSDFPTTSGSTSSAGSYAVQAGGGLNVFLSKQFGVRLLEIDYVRTALPNSGANIQDDLRLVFGVTYHLARPYHRK